MERTERWQITQAIAKELKEKNKQLIDKLIKVAGIEFTNKILEQTRQIQSTGGMMTVDNKRKRTAGGVFFKLAKEHIDPDLRKIVFPPKNWKALKAKRQAQQKADNEAPQPVNPPVETPTEVDTEPQKPTSANANKLAQLEEAAQTLRERIVKMEAKGQKGIKMTKTLLENTEKQIAQLK